MNPVHSSPDAPLFSPPLGHFHAISSSPKSLDTSTLNGPGNKSTRQKNLVVEIKTARRDSCRAENFPQCENSLHQAIIQAHQLSVVIEFQHKLARAHLGFQAQNDSRAQVALQLFDRLADVRVQVHWRRRLRMFSLRSARGSFSIWRTVNAPREARCA